MLSDGVGKGERNQCLGRIVNFYRDVEKYSKDMALESVLEWNAKCNLLCDRAGKSETEIIADFDRYWNKKYHLLGCVPEAGKFRGILSSYCDEASCSKSITNLEIYSKMVYELDGRYVDDSCLRELDGYAYLILRFLSENIKKQYKISDIAGSVGQTKKATKKCFCQEKIIAKTNIFL